ncbi:MAG: hypothetical protein QXX08_07305 [Candidatus Bathyarchaeia archaeon]
MAVMKNSMKNFVIGALIFTALLSTLFLVRAHVISLNNRIAEAERTIEELRKENEQAFLAVKQLNELNRKLKEREEILISEIKKLEAAISTNEIKIKQLESMRPTTPAGCEEVVSHYLLEVEYWKNQFTLAQKRGDAYREAYLSATERITNYETQVAILKNQLDRNQKLLESQQLLMRDLRKYIKINKFDSVVGIASTAIVVTLLALILAK